MEIQLDSIINISPVELFTERQHQTILQEITFQMGSTENIPAFPCNISLARLTGNGNLHALTKIFVKNQDEE